MQNIFELLETKTAELDLAPCDCHKNGKIVTFKSCSHKHNGIRGKNLKPLETKKKKKKVKKSSKCNSRHLPRLISVQFRFFVGSYCHSFHFFLPLFLFFFFVFLLLLGRFFSPQQFISQNLQSLLGNATEMVRKCRPKKVALFLRDVDTLKILCSKHLRSSSTITMNIKPQ